MTRAILISTVGVLLCLGALAFVADPSRWPAPEEPPQQGEAARLQPPGGHDPAALARLVREPQNTWSSLAYVIGGAIILSTVFGQLARATAIAFIAVGIGSFLYHASASETLRHLDVAAMYWLFLMSTALCAAALLPRWRAWLERHAWTLLVATLPVALIVAAARNVELLGLKPLSIRFATALAAAVIILSLAQIARRLETISAALQLLGIVTLFGVAAACQTFDRPGGRFYAPGAIVQAHAVWHVLAAGVFVWAARLLDRSATSTAAT